MTERLRDARIKIERARMHLSSLDSEAAGFATVNPFPVVSDRDANGDTVARVMVAGQPPPVMSAIVGDLVHNLRSALDYVAWQLVESNHGQPDTRTGYPICVAEKDFESSGRAALRGAKEEAILAIRATQPFIAAAPEAHPLEVLRRLDNHDKHRLLHDIGGVVDAFLVKRGPETPGVVFVHRGPRKILVDGDVIATIKSSTSGTLPIKVTVGLVLNSEEAPLRALLESLFVAVEDTVARVEHLLA